MSGMLWRGSDPLQRVTLLVPAFLSAYLHHVLEFAGLWVLQQQSLQHLLEAADSLLVEGLRHKRASETKAMGAVPGGQTRRIVCRGTTQGSLLHPGELLRTESLAAATPFFLHMNKPFAFILLPLPGQFIYSVETRTFCPFREWGCSP